MKNIAITLAACFAFALSACAAPTSGSADDPPSSGTNRPSTSQESTDLSTAEDAIDEPEVQEGMPVQKFGEAFTYADGIQVTVSAPTSMTSSEWASPGSTKGSALTVTLVNGTEAPFDPTMANVTVQSGNSEAEQIYDSEAGYGGSPQTTLLPGREASFKVAFATSDRKDIVLEVSPSWDHEAALYATDAQ